MEFLSLQPFVPSGPEFEKAKEFFTELGFTVTWSDSDYADLERGPCKFVLQRFDKVDFAQNFMLTVEISNAEEFRAMVLQKQLPERFGIRIGEITQEPYGKEVNIIDIAGVCWHFVER